MGIRLYAQVPEPDIDRYTWEEMKIKGKVKTLRKWTSKKADTLNKEELRLLLRVDFDSTGRIARRILTYPDKEPLIHLYKYNSAGRLSKIIYTVGSENSPATETILYEYNDKGQKVRGRSSNVNEAKEEVNTFSYTKEGLLSREATTWLGRPHTARYYQYDAYGRCTTRIDTVDKYRTIYVYHYDSKGNKICETKSNTRGEISMIDSMEYDKAGRMTHSWKQFAPKMRRTLEHVYRYNKDGRLITELDIDHALARTVSIGYTYNKEGLLIKKEYTTTKAGEKEVWCYEYDKQGNFLYYYSCSDPEKRTTSKFEYEYF